jgi:hypothetical protein
MAAPRELKAAIEDMKTTVFSFASEDDGDTKMARVVGNMIAEAKAAGGALFKVNRLLCPINGLLLRYAQGDASTLFTCDEFTQLCHQL